MKIREEFRMIRVDGSNGNGAATWRRLCGCGVDTLIPYSMIYNLTSDKKLPTVCH